MKDITSPGLIKLKGVLFLLIGLLAAALLVGPKAIRGWVEPALAAGAVIVIGYGLAGRLLPGGLHFARSLSALEPRLTAWP